MIIFGRMAVMNLVDPTKASTIRWPIAPPIRLSMALPPTIQRMVASQTVGVVHIVIAAKTPENGQTDPSCRSDGFRKTPWPSQYSSLSPGFTKTERFRFTHRVIPPLVCDPDNLKQPPIRWWREITETPKTETADWVRRNVISRFQYTVTRLW